MPHLDSICTGDDLGHESIIDALVDEESRRTGTHLPLCGDRYSDHGEGEEEEEVLVVHSRAKEV